MNAETERRLAAMIMEEANTMRQRAEKDGVGAYLAKPAVKARPNRQFLTAMVRGVQQANRIVDMEEMWRQRELENKATRDNKSSSSRGRSSRNEKHRYEEEASAAAAAAAERDHYAERRNSNGETASSSDQDNDGLKDEDIEKFLYSKAKRGRGSVGSRMDEPGPYRPCPEGTDADVRQKEDWEARIARPVAGPSLPPELFIPDDDMDSRRKSKKHKENSVDGLDSDEEERKRRRELKVKKRKKEKRKSRDLEKHSKKKKKKRH